MVKQKDVAADGGGGGGGGGVLDEIKRRTKDQTDALAVASTKFKKGKKVETKNMQDRKLRGQLRASERLAKDSAVSAARVDQWLLPAEAGELEAEGMERTWRFQQDAIVGAVDATAARKAFDLTLPDLGPYCLDFSPNGRLLNIAGRKGHLALLDWGRPRVVAELQVREATRAVCFLHNTNYFAAAQEKYAYIYDKRGLEVHCLKEHTQPRALTFLRHFFLLCSIGEHGVLRYQDTSTGTIVAQHRTKLGSCEVLSHNPYSSVALAGHRNGTVTMWSPTMGEPLVRMLCHRGPVRAVAADQSGRYLVTSGADSQVKVWDIRTFQPLHAYFSATPAEALDVSQRGLIALSYGSRVQIWKDALSTKASAPYLNHLCCGGGARVESLRFCPYDDVLAVGHNRGISSILVPGSGEPNFDSFVANPYETKKQRQEAEVHMLLDKLQPGMIQLDPDRVGTVVRLPTEVQAERQKMALEAEVARRHEQEEKTDGRKKMKGRRRASRVHRRKQTNVIDEKRLVVVEKNKIREKLREGQGVQSGGAAAGTGAGAGGAGGKVGKGAAAGGGKKSSGEGGGGGGAKGAGGGGSSGAGAGAGAVPGALQRFLK